MKVIVHEMPSGVAISHLNRRLIAKMVGPGFGWGKDRIDREAAKAPQGKKTKLRPYYLALAHGGLTEDQAVELIRLKDDPAGCLSCRVIDDSELPAEQALRGVEPTFRDAWEDTGTAVQVNMPKAQVIHMERIREVRNAELAKLDVPYMKALEAGDPVEQQRIAAPKQALRDIPQTFDLSGFGTPEELTAAWPGELLKA